MSPLRKASLLCACVQTGLTLGYHPTSPTQLPEPVDLIPAESLLCWYGRPTAEPAGAPPATAASTQPTTLQALLEFATRLAGPALDRSTQLNLRMAEMFGLMTRYPYALTLIDARAKPTTTNPEARQVDQLRFVLVVQNEGQTEPFLNVIQKAVNEQTDAAAATLAGKRAGRWEYQELRDRRLPDWAAIAWGQIDGHFVLTVGSEVWPQIAAVAAGHAPALSRETWYAAVRGEAERRDLVEIFVAARNIRERLDPFVAGRASAFFQAWDADTLEQAHWVIGFEQRALYCRAQLRTAATTLTRQYADPRLRDARVTDLIPAEARYALCNVWPGRLLPRICRGFLAVQGEQSRANLERHWADIQARAGVDVERDLLAQLGQRIIVHDYPPHPLRIPLALTTLIEIRDQPESVRQVLDRLCSAWSEVLEAADRGGAEAAQAAPSSATRQSGPARGRRYTLHHDDDGIWYLRFPLAGASWLGLAGPAWTVTDHFIVLSWSPVALRTYLESARPGQRASPHAPEAGLPTRPVR